MITCTHAYLDLDQVGADWCLQAAFTIHQRKPYLGTVLEIAERLDTSPISALMDEDEFWLETNTVSWWATLPELSQRFDCPTAVDLWAQVAVAYPDAKRAFLTALPYGKRNVDLSCAAAGKMAWLHDRFGDDFAAILCPKNAKADLAGPTRLLIDDDELNVHNFARAGGAAILYRPAHALPALVHHALLNAEPGRVLAL